MQVSVCITCATCRVLLAHIQGFVIHNSTVTFLSHEKEKGKR